LQTYEVNEIPNDPEVIKQEFSEEDFKTEDERVVYDNLPHQSQFKITEELNEQASTSSLFIPKEAIEEGCLFYSKFECGNLKRAIKLSNTEYNLLIEPDFNTKGHMHWFYFQISSKLPKGTVLTFHISNLLRGDSLYANGLEPVVFSHNSKEDGFTRGNCSNMAFSQTP